MSDGYRQEVLNVLLAQLLQERGVVTAPESIVRSGPERRMPDVIVSFHGLRTAIEGEVSDRPEAQERAIHSARSRVEEGIAHVGIATVYPAQLRQTPFGELKNALAASRLQIAIVTESGGSGFVVGNVDYLESALRNAFEQLVQEDVVARAVAALDAGIEQFASTIAGKGGILGRVAETLGIRELPQEGQTAEEETE